MIDSTFDGAKLRILNGLSQLMIAPESVTIESLTCTDGRTTRVIVKETEQLHDRNRERLDIGLRALGMRRIAEHPMQYFCDYGQEGTTPQKRVSFWKRLLRRLRR